MSASAQALDAIGFALASCQYPAGLLDRELAERALHRLGDLCARDRSIRHLILAGDQIYADATAGLFDPASPQTARREAYHAMRSSQGFQDIQSMLREVLSLPDDHEIVDNWEPLPDGHPQAPAHRALMEAAMRDFIRACRRDAQPGAPIWFDWTCPDSGLRAFLIDTRTTREARRAETITQAQLLDKPQWQALDAWMRAAPTDAPSLLVSPAMPLPRTLRVAEDADAALHSDGWDGYPASLHRLLALFAELPDRRFVFLSGDEHLGCLARITLQRADASLPAASVHSLHCPALFAPYPFANARPAQFRTHETFEFEVDAGAGLRSYRCRVETEYPPPGDGFVLLRAQRAHGNWRLAAEFHRAQAGAEPWRVALG